MAIKKFEELKNDIQKAIEKKSMNSGQIQGEPDGFVLIDGFFNLPIQNEIGGAIMFGGQTVPTVAIAGKTTGRLHFFALKALLPEVEI